MGIKRKQYVLDKAFQLGITLKAVVVPLVTILIFSGVLIYFANQNNTYIRNNDDVIKEIVGTQESMIEMFLRTPALYKSENEAVRNGQRTFEDNIGKLMKINKTSRERFLETFNLVNEKFSEVIPLLFGGGMAHLVLTEPDDPLESGVDIVVRPPGKKLTNINLLSGGEKALSSIGLIFSIFLIRPSPFCLLDEVDAPLDDENVSRFNQLVQQMAAHSQVILITHNKETMECVDTLYGVTMQEHGVSKLVSVRLVEDPPVH